MEKIVTKECAVMNRAANSENMMTSFVRSAVQVDMSRGNQVEQIKEKVIGSKTRYRFTCQSCEKATVTSAGAYENEEGELRKSIRTQARYEVMRVASGWFRGIPYVGRILSQVMRSVLYGIKAPIPDGKMLAFEEIKGKFNLCDNCGRYVCATCYQEGVCVSCQTSRANE